MIHTVAMLLAWGLVLAGVYCALCWHVVYNRGPFGFSHNSLVAWCLRRMDKVAITIGSTCYVSNPAYLHPIVSAPGTPLYKHEFTHFGQWLRWPLTFVPRYLWKQVTQGYDRNDFEQEAEHNEHA